MRFAVCTTTLTPRGYTSSMALEWWVPYEMGRGGLCREKLAGLVVCITDDWSCSFIKKPQNEIDVNLKIFEDVLALRRIAARSRTAKVKVRCKGTLHSTFFSAK